MINRREAINRVLATGVIAPLYTPHSATAKDASTRADIVDTNVTLFQWPFRRLPLDESQTLVTKLQALSVWQAWAGSFDGVFHRDISAVNKRLAETCKSHPELLPIGSVNPALPDWQEDLRQCIELHDMRGIRLHPNYHGYTLDDPIFFELLNSATKAGLFTQIAVAMEDARTQHAMLRVPDVDLTPLPKLVDAVPNARIQILNHRLRTVQPKELAATAGVYFDTARVDGTDGIPSLVAALPAGRVMHGTHAPFLIPEAALIRTHESGQLEEPALRAVLSENASKFLETSAI